MPAVWTPSARAELSPRRGEARAPSLEFDAAWTIDEVTRRAQDRRAVYEKGRAHPAAAALAAQVDAAFAAADSYARDEPPRDAAAEGALLVVLRSRDEDTNRLARAIVRRWIARAGVAFAVTAAAEHASLASIHPPRDGARVDFHAAWLAPRAAEAIFPHHADARADIERAVLSASDADYGATVAVVAALRARVPTMAANLTALVPTEHAAARADVEAFLAADEPSHACEHEQARLFAVLDDVDVGARLLERLLSRGRFEVLAAHVFDAARLLDDRALSPLAAQLDAWHATELPSWAVADARRFARAVALFDDARAAVALASWVGEARSLGPVAIEFFHRFPSRAAAALAARIGDKNKKGEAARELLTRVARLDAAAVAAAAAALAPSDRAAVERLVASLTVGGGAAEAALDELPRVLADPPWRAKGAKRLVAPTLSRALSSLPYDERVTWASDDERARASRRRGGPILFRMTQAELSALAQADMASGARRSAAERMRPLQCALADVADADALRLWSRPPPPALPGDAGYVDDLAHMLARFDVAAIAGAVTSMPHLERSPEAVSLLLQCDSPHVAIVAARASSQPASAKAAAAWIDGHATAATLGLLPLAVGPASRDKSIAGVALRGLAARGGEASIIEVARRFGEDVVDAARAVLSFDPLFECPKAPPKLAGFADPAALPPLALADGRRVPEVAARSLLEMLQLSPASPPYAGLATLAGVFDPASLDAFLRALLEAWLAAGAATASAWALRAVGHLGGDAAARDLAGRVRRWPREKGRSRAIAGVEVLGRMGSDVALMHLADLARTARVKSIEELAAAALTAAAVARGLDDDALADRLVPTLELDARGETTLDFGPRRFTLRVDETLAPRLFDGAAPLRALPRPAKTDDAAKARAAALRYKALRSDLETVGKTLVARLEAAMIGARRWSPAEHATLLVAHPLTGLVARRLVFAVFTGEGRGRAAATFRVAEDGSLADDADDPFVLADDARVGVPHPLELDADVRALWAARFTEYELLQPFEQLGRATFEVDADELARCRRTDIPYGVLVGRLEARGFRRGGRGDGGFTKAFGSRLAAISVSPPLEFGDALPERLAIVGASFDAPLAEVDPIARSELVYDLAPLRR